MSVKSASRYLLESFIQGVTDLPVFWEPPFGNVRVAAYRILGASVADGAIFQQRVRVRVFRNLTVHRNTLVCFDTRIHAEARVTVFEDSIIGPGAGIYTGNHSLQDLSPGAQPISIGPRSFIGARAVILGGVTIGADAIVGAGAVVSRDVPSGAVVAGSPAKVLRFRENIGASCWTINGHRPRYPDAEEERK
jgi:putative colanic acid biosynthesis acetyltransferase WcaF